MMTVEGEKFTATGIRIKHEIDRAALMRKEATMNGIGGSRI